VIQNFIIIFDIFLRVSIFCASVFSAEHHFLEMGGICVGEWICWEVESGLPGALHFDLQSFAHFEGLGFIKQQPTLCMSIATQASGLYV